LAPSTKQGMENICRPIDAYRLTVKLLIKAPGTIYWRPGVYYNTDLEPKASVTVICSGFMLILFVVLILIVYNLGLLDRLKKPGIVCISNTCSGRNDVIVYGWYSVNFTLL